MLRELLEEHEFLVLDGALATELEARGYDLEDPLWSARVLLEDPDAIRKVHVDYLKAGADILTTASYQATFQGFRERGLSAGRTRDLLLRSVQLAVEAVAEIGGRGKDGRVGPLVAASIGPYGAYRHDGSEYRGDYEIGTEELVDFHRDRFGCLSATGVDLLALETVPCLSEARAYSHLLREYTAVEAWLSFSCRDDRSLSSGESIQEAVELVDQMERVVAVGVNCTGPQWIDSIVETMKSATSKPIIVYPNSGECWDSLSHGWIEKKRPQIGADLLRRWVDAGAQILGGCCRTGPELVRLIAGLRDS
ncbi:MAG: homocysteine S-methyltransferase [Planctomycetota bacterium]|jgi:homocysteine S-methyltransferase|nr:homocysteine S-methyltransferase [Planctomycetota bacterium]